MSRVVCIDGVLCAPEDAKVSAYDRGFLYGDSVFETIRTYASVPHALGEHLARLERSAGLSAIPMPVGLEVFEAEIRAALDATRNAESYIRVMLTRGSGPLGLDPALASAPLRVIFVDPLVTLPASMYADGVAVITQRTGRAADAAHGAKVGNYLGNLLALRAAKQAGAHEALLLDAEGRIVEGTTSNVFIVKTGTLRTPPDEAGILPGITRAALFDVARELGFAVTLGDVSPRDVVGADEAFLTSSIREVLPVVSIDGSRIGAGSPGPVTRAIHEGFRRRVGLGDRPMPWESGPGSSV